MVATIALIAIGPAVSASGAADPPIPGILPTTTTTAKPKPPLRPTTTTTAYESRVPQQGFGTGDHDAAIRTAELMLNGQHYDVGKIDDSYDQDTAYAVTAFQKIHGMERTGRLTPDVAARLRQEKSPPPALMGPDAGTRRAEIDLPRQVLLLIVDNAVFK